MPGSSEWPLRLLILPASLLCTIFLDSPAIVFYSRSGSFIFSDVSKSWKILLLLVVEHDVPLDRTLSFLALAKFPPLQYPISFGHNFPNNLPLHPSPFFSDGLQPTIGCSWFSCHHPSLAEADEFMCPWCSFVFVPSRPLGDHPS